MPTETKAPVYRYNMTFDAETLARIDALFDPLVPRIRMLTTVFKAGLAAMESKRSEKAGAKK